MGIIPRRLRPSPKDNDKSRGTTNRAPGSMLAWQVTNSYTDCSTSCLGGCSTESVQLGSLLQSPSLIRLCCGLAGIAARPIYASTGSLAVTLYGATE